MQRKRRILHVITLLELGGAQQNTLFCTAHHDRERFEVGLLAGRGGMLDDDAQGIPDARVRLVPWLRHSISPFWDLLALFRLRAHLREAQVDLVHTHSSKAGILGRLAAWWAGVPAVVHTVHGWSFNDMQGVLQRRAYIALERLAAKFTDRILVVAEAHRDCGLRHGIGTPEQYAVLRSGIDVQAFSTRRRPRDVVRRELGFNGEHTVVGTIACLKPQKAPLDFVRAAAAAHAQNEMLRFFIAGDGRLQPQVESEIHDRGMQGIIVTLGWRDDVADLLHASDVFLLTSLFEGLPRVVLQAMAAGVPVVATAVDGTPEVVEDGVTGLLTPPGDPVAAAERVLRMASDAELRTRCVDEARRRLTGEFDIHGMVQELDRLYAELLSDPVS